MKPIIFNTEMVKAILDGRKTQIRRLIKNNKKAGLLENRGYFYRDKFSYNATNNFDDFGKNKIVKLCSKYQTGDILYVKETFNLNGDCWGVAYPLKINYKADSKENGFKWISSNIMRKEYARIFLKVTNVRVERLQNISDEDCLKDGIENVTNYNPIELHRKFDTFRFNGCCYNSAKYAFKNIWNSTAKDGYKWEDNPYVFVYEFERVEK